MLITKAMQLSTTRWKGTKNLGTYVNRPVRNPNAKGALSTHATGFAMDLGFRDEAQAREIWDFYVGNSLALNVAAVHWYTFGTHGAAYRCNCGEGKAGVKIFTKDELGAGGPWLHIELVDMDSAEWGKRFRALKPKNA